MNTPPSSQQKSVAFLIHYPQVVRQIVTPVEVSIPPVANAPATPGIKVNAIWDTGATGSVITTKLATALKLFPVTKANVSTANGTVIQNVYFVSIVLPNGVRFNGVKVTEVKSLNGPFEVLIGMDIISYGDFAISNFGGKTTVSFRVPSIPVVDFVPQSHITPNNPNQSTQQQIGPNIPPKSSPQPPQVLTPHISRRERREMERKHKKK